MRERPTEFKVLAALLVLVALSFPIQVMVGYGYSPVEFGAVISSLAPLNWVIMALCLLNGYLALNASRALFATVPVFLVAVFWNNWLVARMGLNASAFAAFGSAVGAIAIHGVLLRKQAVRVLMNPRMRWWRTAPRARAMVRATLRPVLGSEELRTLTFDLSMGGAFVQITEGFSAGVKPGQNTFRKLKPGARCTVRLTLDQLNVLNCGAEIVRQVPARGNYPAGLGLRFISLDAEQKRILAQFIESATGGAKVGASMLANTGQKLAA